MLTHSKSNVSEDHISASRRCCPLTFLHVVQNGQGLLTHTYRKQGSPTIFQNKKFNYRYGAKPNVRPPGAVTPNGETIKRVKTPLLAASRGPNAIALAYVHRTRSVDLGWVEIRQLNFVANGPKFTQSFSSNAGGIVVDNTVFSLLMALSDPETFALKV